MSQGQPDLTDHVIVLPGREETVRLTQKAGGRSHRCPTVGQGQGSALGHLGGGPLPPAVPPSMGQQVREPMQRHGPVE